MTAALSPSATAAVARGLASPLVGFVRRRFANPGMVYNTGNWLALAAAATAAVLEAHGDAFGAAGGLARIFAGSGAALAVSLGSLAFFVGGARYDRAWAQGAPPHQARLREGHALSALGALCLGVGLAALAKDNFAFAAAVCGCALHTSGKLGSVWRGDVWLFKAMPLASRAPAVISLLADVGAASSGRRAVAACVLIVCNLVWAYADGTLLYAAAQSDAPKVVSPM